LAQASKTRERARKIISRQGFSGLFHALKRGVALPTAAALTREQNAPHPAQITAPSRHLFSVHRRQASKPAHVVDMLVAERQRIMALVVGHAADPWSSARIASPADTRC
jgi:hypothetical protein